MNKTESSKGKDTMPDMVGRLQGEMFVYQIRGRSLPGMTRGCGNPEGAPCSAG